MNVSKQEINKIFEEIAKQMIDIGIPIMQEKINPIVQYNKRTSSFGLCKRNNKIGAYTVYLSEFALQDKEEIKETLAHELIHTLDGCMNHGTKWLYWANIAN